MKNVTSILSLAILAEFVFVSGVQAERIAHRPWLARPAASDYTSDSVRIPTRHLRVTGKAAKGERIAEQASRYRGVRYRFGGDSKFRGFDCSGLVSRVYNDLHLAKLPHNSDGLYRMGRPVHMSELRAGDLVFFKNTYKRGISHVGVYAGDNHFIHARNRHYGVTVTSLADPYYQLHYAGARRLY